MLLLLKSLSKPGVEIRKEPVALHILVQADMQLRSRRQDQDREKVRLLTQHFIVVSALSQGLLRYTSKGGDAKRSKLSLKCKLPALRTHPA
jgi:hypothetical protein